MNPTNFPTKLLVRFCFQFCSDHLNFCNCFINYINFFIPGFYFCFIHAQIVKVLFICHKLFLYDSSTLLCFSFNCSNYFTNSVNLYAVFLCFCLNPIYLQLKLLVVFVVLLSCFNYSESVRLFVVFGFAPFCRQLNHFWGLLRQKEKRNP